MAAPYKRKFAGIIVLMILAAVVTLLNPEIQKHLVDDVLKRREGGISTSFYLPWHHVFVKCRNCCD